MENSLRFTVVNDPEAHYKYRCVQSEYISNGVLFPDAFIRKIFNTDYYFYYTSGPVSLKLVKIYIS